MNETSKINDPLSMLHKLSELKQQIEFNQSQRTVTSTLETNLQCPDELFLSEEIEAILMQLDDVRTDILYLESPCLTEGKLYLSSLSGMIHVNEYPIKENEPVEVRLDGESRWMKTWIAHDGTTYYFTCFGRKINALNVDCTVRLRKVHQTRTKEIV